MDKSETSSTLFKAWTEYAKAVGVKPGNTVTFKDRMLAAGFRFYRGKRAREFFGVRLRLTTTRGEE